MPAPGPVSVAAPTGLLLRPGVPVLRRDANTIQVGLHPPLAVRLPDRPEVRSLLDALQARAPLAALAPVAERALDALLAAGLVFPGLDEPGRRGLAAARAQFGVDGSRRVSARAAHAVGLLGDPRMHATLAPLALEAGLLLDQDSPAVWVVVGCGQLSREGIDGLVRSGAPHLVVSGGASGRRIGPFVEPGRTACLRCVDAHESEPDPRRSFLVEQAARTTGTDVPVDPVLDQLALAWAVRDVCRYVEGEEPSTWSATVDLGPTDAPEVRRWLRHPHCGCAWDLLLDLP
ncbi:hypothetical protein [Nocardioides sp. MH1]|uniref:hypothetical protein n=1 Tax=Nocardioides sp. MH1 TaxID=3242490 RepID=UPI00351FC54C